MGEMRLYSNAGQRLYLTSSERVDFETASRKQDRETMTFALVMLYTGCRISEALELRARNIDLENMAVGIESLKKRRKGIFRSIPIPERLVEAIDLVHAIRESKDRNRKLWEFSRMTAWRKIKEIMAVADITGPHATPKGLRHGFGVHAIAHCGIPLNMVQKWLGHSDLKTTAIYANAVGKEERDIAHKMWN